MGTGASITMNGTIFRANVRKWCVKSLTPTVDEGYYINITELVLLMSFVFVPALLLGFVVETWYLASRQIVSCKRWFPLGVTWLLTTIVSGCLAWVLLPIDLRPVSRILGITDLRIAGTTFPVMPLAFIVVGISSFVVTLLVTKYFNRRS